MHSLYAAVRPVGAISLSTGCFTESRWAALTKPATASLDLGLVVGQRAPNSRDELVDFYSRYGLDDKIAGVDAALDKWKGRESRMFDALYKKYDVEIRAKSDAAAKDEV